MHLHVSESEIGTAPGNAEAVEPAAVHQMVACEERLYSDDAGISNVSLWPGY